MRLTGLLATICLTFSAPWAAAQDDFPSRTIRLVVPYQPGSQPDMQARALAQPMGEILKQTVVVENKPGAGGLIGADIAAKATPDGHTIAYVSNQHLIHKYLLKSVPYDFFKDLKPIGIIGVGGQVIITRVDEKATNLQEFVADLAKRGRPALFGSGGIGSPAHLGGQALATAGTFPATHVPYKGSPDSINGLITGDVDYIVTTIPTAAPLIKDGKLKALAVTTEQRDETLPDVPTVVEAMPPGFSFEPWGALVTAAQVPDSAVKKLADALNAFVTDPKGVEALKRTAMRPANVPPGQLEAFMRADEQKLARWIQDAGIQAQ